MGCAPHHLASQGAGCRSCLKRQFGKKSPQGEALTKAKITLFAEENFVSKILCRQEGKPQHKVKLKLILYRLLTQTLSSSGKARRRYLLFIGEGVAVPDGVDFAGIVRVQVFAV